MHRTAALSSLLAALATAPLAAQHAGHTMATASERPTGQSRVDPRWLSWEAGTRTVRFELIGGAPGAKSPFNFNGFVDGELTLVVPEGATVVMNFVNEDGVPHSAEIILDKDPMPNMAGDPAIPRAYTRKAIEGLNQGERDVMRFTAAPAGEYRIFCGVPGHGLSGMWIRLRVSASATEPSMVETPKQG